jgi:hypothetical protein
MTREGIVEHKKRLAKMAAERTVEKIEKIRKHLNIHPWNAGGEATPDEALMSFSQMMNDLPAWVELIAHERRLWHLTPDRAPRRLVREVADMTERYLAKGGVVQPFPTVEEIEPAPIEAAEEEVYNAG